jgi:hypothetical protein
LEDGSDVPPSKASKTDPQEGAGTLHSDIQVNIVQQLNPQQTSQIKLTVQTVQTSGPGAGEPAQGGNQSGHTSATIQTSTSVCKQEPLDDPQCSVSSCGSDQGTFPETVGFDDIDELKEILDTLEKEEGEIPSDLITTIESLTQENEERLAAASHSVGDTENKDSSVNTVMFADPVYENTGSNQSLPNMGGPSAAPVSYNQQQIMGGGVPQPPQMSFGDTGPAAETLKNLAAQHQNQMLSTKPVAAYPPEYVDMYHRGAYPQMPGQPGYPPTNNMYPYNQAMGNMGRPPSAGVAGPRMAIKPDPAIGYGSTKPLTHYQDAATPQTQAHTPSSLQQLQNQVHSHFSQAQAQGQGSQNQGQHMQITQSQHMQMSHGNQHMQMSQTQQMQIQGSVSPQISVAQQQSFSMPQQQGRTPQQQAGYMNEQQLKMQAYQRQQMERQAQMQQQQQPYMNRPPPEYARQNSANGGYPNNNIAANQNNPLQTMQNMVNATNNGQPAGADGYSKGDINPMAVHPGMHPAMNRRSPMTGTSHPPQSEMSRFPHPQQSQMGGQNMPNGTAPTRPMKSSTPTYTSAIMRNQRPPNVNVGPEGLNISQQRAAMSAGEWPRPMVPGGPPMGPGPAGNATPPYGAHHGGPGMPANSMMHYSGYSNHASMGMSGPRMHMQHQQQAQGMHAQTGQRPPHPNAPTNMPPGMNPAVAQNNSAMMMSQQQQQQMQMQNNRAMGSVNMSQSMSMSMASQQQQQQQQQHPQQTPQQQQQRGATNYPQPESVNGGASGAEFPLDFLDNPPASSSDFFDSVVPSTNPSDFNLIDELLGK